MNRRIRIAAIAAVVSVAGLAAQTAMAGSVAGNGGATEVTQIMNNAELAMQTIQEEISAIQLEMANYYNLMQQLPTQLGQFATSVSEIQGALKGPLGMLNQLQNLYGSVSNLKNVAQLRFQSFSASGLDWNSYVKRERAYVQNKNDQYGLLNEQERAAISDVETNYDAIQRFQGQIGGTTGTHSAMIVMNGQMNALLGQVNQMIRQTAVHDTVDTNEKRDDLARKERARGNSDGAYSDLNDSIYKNVIKPGMAK